MLEVNNRPKKLELVMLLMSRLSLKALVVELLMWTKSDHV